MYARTSNDKWLRLASQYAKDNSGCLKVSVGAVIVKDNKLLSIGANRTIPNLCKTSRGCLRVEKYGEASKLHRNPEDCRAIHSEVDAISTAGQSLVGATIYVTRYPCEGCAKAIVAAGIAKVVYGRNQAITVETHKILEGSGVDIINYNRWVEEDILT